MKGIIRKEFRCSESWIDRLGSHQYRKKHRGCNQIYFYENLQRFRSWLLL